MADPAEANVSPSEFSGYEDIADLMASVPRVANFRKFGSLSMLHLLKLQADLAALERKLKPPRQSPNGSVAPVGSPGVDDSADAATEESLRKLQEYYNLLLQVKQIGTMSTPDQAQIDLLRFALFTTRGEPRRPKSQQIYDDLGLGFDETESDIISLAVRQEDDFSRLFRPWLLILYRIGSLLKLVSPILCLPFMLLPGDAFDRMRVTFETTGKFLKNVEGYEDGTVIRIRRAESTIFRFIQQSITLIVITIVSLLPAFAILVLNSIDTTNKRIYVTIAFTGGLAILLRVMTDANLKEVFGATLGFVAIEVVFIGSAIEKGT